jgi:hypothetical protein
MLRPYFRAINEPVAGRSQGQEKAAPGGGAAFEEEGAQ